MSHPDSTKDYSDNILDRFSNEELDKLFNDYKLECSQAGVEADLSQFPVWLEEKYF